MLEIVKSLVRELDSGRPAVLASIIRQAGSAPRSLGTKFLILQDGRLVGSIGGGIIEARVIRAAEKLMGRSSALVMEFRLSGREVAGTDMICGGDVDVLVQGFTPEADSERRVWKAVLRLLEKGGQGVLAAGPLPAPGVERTLGLFFFRPDEEPAGKMPSETETKDLIRRRFQEILASNVLTLHSGPAGPVVLEPLFSQPTVIIFGGGHISVNLAPLLSLVGFRVIVMDDRPEFISPERFPHASQLIVSDYESCFEQMEFTPETYCVIVTRGHLHDKTILGRVLRQTTRYVGMIGSRRKRRMIYEALQEEGLSPDLLAQVHAPIGLDIGAETPEEIAVAITAELIQVRADSLAMVKEWQV